MPDSKVPSKDDQKFNETPSRAAKNPAGKGKPQPPHPRQDSWRETIESVVVAFILAFLFRTFEAEAFVIPTGSMAPTLYGQHRDVYCEKCGTRFAVGVSSPPAPDAEIRAGWIIPGDRTSFAVCPNANCRFPNDVLDQEIFAGDRILVNKFPYEIGTPERWDVVVFKFPEGAKTNYIKRLVGLPGEELKIEGGDIFVRPLGTLEPYRIARKTPEKQRKLQLLAHDNDHPAKDLLAAGWPEAWTGVNTSAWSSDPEARAFRVDPDGTDGDQWQWLRYRHYIPTASDWTRVLDKQPLLSSPQPQLVRDFYAYNGRITARMAESAVARGELPELPSNEDGSQWVGDLTINCVVEVLAPGGEVLFELIEGGRRYRSTVDLKTGKGRLSYIHERDSQKDGPETEGEPVGEPFDTGMNSAGSFKVSFANVDERLCFWVDNRLVKFWEFDVGGRFEPSSRPITATELDRSPVGIASRGAKLRVSHLLLERDTYYLNEGPGGMADRNEPYLLKDSENDLEDEFLMLGDNSPRSNDSRLWTQSHAVQRRLLIGKAFFIYWPHGVPFMNDGKGFAIGNYQERGDGADRPPLPKFSVPFYPQVGRMHRIR